MNLFKKFGKHSSSEKGGVELRFNCPKCRHNKFYLNTIKNVYHCFRCGYSGKIHFDKKAWTPIHLQVVEDKYKVEIPGLDTSLVMPMVMANYLINRGIEKKPTGWGISTDLRLRDRIIIPILEDGEIVTWVARAVDNNELKEISGPKKSLFLYNLDEIQAGCDVILVEGIFDCLALERAGYKAAAIMGSHLSDIQIGKLLAKHPASITIMLDGDDAGRKGSLDAMKRLLKRARIPINRVQLLEGKDPDELTKKELSKFLPRL